jgi:hypothetical protein
VTITTTETTTTTYGIHRPPPPYSRPPDYVSATAFGDGPSLYEMGEGGHEYGTDGDEDQGGAEGFSNPIYDMN